MRSAREVELSYLLSGIMPPLSPDLSYSSIDYYAFFSHWIPRNQKDLQAWRLVNPNSYDKTPLPANFLDNIKMASLLFLNIKKNVELLSKGRTYKLHSHKYVESLIQQLSDEIVAAYKLTENILQIMQTKYQNQIDSAVQFNLSDPEATQVSKFLHENYLHCNPNSILGPENNKLRRSNMSIFQKIKEAVGPEKQKQDLPSRFANNKTRLTR